MSTNKQLTRASLEQLRAYVHTRDETGWYYGNREHFERRHQALVKWIETEIQKRDNATTTERELCERCGASLTTADIEEAQACTQCQQPIATQRSDEDECNTNIETKYPRAGDWFARS